MSNQGPNLPTEQQNPFASPVNVGQGNPFANASKVTKVQGIWREGNLIVAANGIEFPPYCVKCNAPVERLTKKQFSWHNPLLALSILAGLIIYVILVLVLQKKALLHYGVCKKHKAIRRNALLIYWLLVFPGMIALFILGIANEIMWLPLVAFLLVIILGIVAAILSLHLKPTKITDTHAWLKGACPEYLQNLPHV